MPNPVIPLLRKGKRTVIVADDEYINRQILFEMLKEDYHVLLAEDGAEAYDIVQKNSKTISLILLDLIMLNMTGLELLDKLKSHEKLSRIPVIVLTANQDSEVASLNAGAVDFIPKPYPQPDVVRARVRRAIELSEDRQIISDTQYDVLTGLYTEESFYLYTELFDRYYYDLSADAVVLGINNFHIFNERYGDKGRSSFTNDG
ncbi:response regulator [Oribacterium sp. WCC10]|uniref:response regulator n=1 Tax=Oribacterium sp. WCC10 TaxID=1855343 RepID=UPI0008F2C482|nr:response regulator [Oribacterium sp. WCC10]SFG76526.1 Response regulator receiver domain-containing protein [Oribacterium sp. WCC10]